MRPDGSSSLSVHPLSETLHLKDSKYTWVNLEATPFVSSKNKTLVSPSTRQHKYTNLILHTIGNQLNITEENIPESMPKMAVVQEKIKNFFSLKSFKKESNEKKKEKKFKKII